MNQDELERKVRKEAEKLDKLYNDNEIDMSEYIRRKQDLWRNLERKES